MEVVVVLPCVPATEIPVLPRMSSASISARGITGIPSRRASATSGLAGFTAEEVTTTCAPWTLSARWPSAMRAPSFCSRRVESVSARSEPETR
jgi:hypothetical protein